MSEGKKEGLDKRYTVYSLRAGRTHEFIKRLIYQVVVNVKSVGVICPDRQRAEEIEGAVKKQAGLAVTTEIVPLKKVCAVVVEPAPNTWKPKPETE